MSELQIVVDRVEGANYWEVFPDRNELKSTYRKLSRIVHPDRYQGTEQEAVASATFAQLGVLLAEAEEALKVGRYGEPVVMATIRSRSAVHTVKEKLAGGDLTDLFRAGTLVETGTVDSIVKIARSPRDNDLLAAEATALKKLHATPDKFERHIPVLLDTFVYQEGRRRANAIGWLDGFSTGEQVRAAYSGGIDPRHIAWVWRRLLMALGYAHDLGVIHGAVLPPHIMIEPKDHAVILVDWCYSVIKDENAYPTPIKLTVPGWKTFYPEEVWAKEPPSPATDIAMAAYSTVYLSGTSLPKPMRAYFKGCTLEKKSMRPQNAWALLKEFDDLLELMGDPYYPRRWVEFAVPTGVA